MASLMRAGYYSNVNPELLAAIPLHSTKILELGAGTGAFGAAFKRRNPQARWIGVELMSEAASLAADTLDEVYIADVENHTHELPWNAWQQSMDAIVLGDVLEHLKDPWSILSRLTTCLAPDGVVVACIPNVGHWTIIDGLLRGEFSYRDQGLLDRTHLRFFTASSMVQLFTDAGLTPLKIRSREIVIDKPRFEAFMESMQARIATAGLDPAAVRQRCATMQYVLRAVRSQKPANKHALSTVESSQSTELIDSPRPQRAQKLVIIMLAMAPSFADVRTKLPVAAYGSLIDCEVHYFEHQVRMPDLPVDLPKVLIVQRQLPANLSEWQATVQRLQAKGWLVLAEWDDHPALFAPRIRENFDRAPWASVATTHGVITSTEPLANEIKGVRGDERILLFDNRLIELPPAKSPRSVGSKDSPVTERIRVFYGALNRTAEASSLMGTIAPILARYPHVELVVLQDRAVFDAAHLVHKRFVPHLSYSEYHELLAQCDIALLPLADSEGNACKSDLKFIECAAHEIVCIASPTVYASTIVHGVTGLIAANDQAFAQALERLLDDEAMRLRMASAARLYVAEHRLWSQVLSARVQALRQAWHEWRTLCG